MRVFRCKECKIQPTIQYYGTGRIDIYCPSMVRTCCRITGTDHKKAVDNWNQIYGEQSNKMEK